ncbi:MAG: LolA family protein [Blastocatellia bacterium]
MKRLTSLAITVTLLLGMMTVATTDTQANVSAQLLTGVLQKMESSYRGLKGLRASIVQKRVNSQIGTSDTDYGVAIYKPGDKKRLRIDYTKPDTRTLAVVGDSVTFYQPTINQAFKGTMGKMGKGKNGYSVLLSVFTGAAGALRTEFQTDYLRDELVNGKNTSVLRLIPRDKKQFESAEIWVSHENWLVVQVMVTEKNRDYTLLRMDRVEMNARLGDGDFNVKLQPGTAVVDKM